MTKLEIFVEIMKSNFYFSNEERGTNRLEVRDDENNVIIYGADADCIYGMASIGQVAETLHLSCYVHWNPYDKRIEAVVH